MHVWLFFSAIFRRVIVQMTCALNFAPFSVFSCLLDVFSLCCVCFLDMCARVVVFFCDFPTCIWADDICSQLCAF